MQQANQKMVESAQSKHALIVGLGKTGASVARYLRQQGYAVAVTDSRAQPPGLERLQQDAPDAAQFLGGFSEVALESADLLVVSPGISPAEPYLQAAQARGLTVIGDIELFARELNARQTFAAVPVLAVTGSNGKSTVATLAGLMAQRAGKQTAVGGNIGVPALDLLAGESASASVFVLELSSFQLETTGSLRPAAAVVLNVTPDHMDRYASLADYAAAKARILSHCGTAIINRDDPVTRDMAKDAKCRISFGLDKPPGNEDFGIIEKAGASWLAQGEYALMPVSELLLAGRHNQANALAALALIFAAGLDMESALDVLLEFKGLPHRAEFVARHDDVIYLNDSKATNTGAAAAAINGFEQPLIVIAGGDAKGADFTELAQLLAGRYQAGTLRAVILMGRDAGLIHTALERYAPDVPVYFGQHMDDAVRIARDHAQPNDIVLLSPACASFDMFTGFEARGQAFITAVREFAA